MISNYCSFFISISLCSFGIFSKKTFFFFLLSKDGTRFDTDWICTCCGNTAESLCKIIEHSLMNCDEVENYFSDTHRCLCLICGKRELNSKLLKDHVTHSHNSMNSFFPCIPCKRHFYLVEDYDKHLKTYHDTKSREDHLETCKYCGKKFLNRSKLNRHIRCVHTAHRYYVCPSCPESFKLMEQLTRHSKIHESSKKIKCNICDKAFRTNSNLKQHLTFHEVQNKKKNQLQDTKHT